MSTPNLFRILATLFIGFLLVTASPGAFAPQDDEERQRAFQLFRDTKYTEALPLFEKLAATNPNDSEVLETFGFLLITQTTNIKDAAARKQARARGREFLVRAQKLGSNSALLKSLLETLPPDGGDDRTFSTKKEVEEAMQEGERAFNSGNMPKAIEMYGRALLL